MHVGLLLADLCCHPRHVPHCLHRYRRDSESPADSGRHLPSDADIFPHYIPWHWLYVFVQLLCFCPAGGWKLRPSSSLLNIALDLWFVIGLHFGVGGAAGATVIAQAVSGIGITIAVLRKNPQLFPSKEQRIFQKTTFSEVNRYAFFTCLQQSVMNFGILMIQGLVNSFGTAIMAAFAAAVKIDTLAYMPVQEFGNAFSLFISQNHGAKHQDRVRAGIHTAVQVSITFCIVISAIIWIFARPLMQIFVDAGETSIIAEGVRYLHIEGTFYWGIGCLFLLYGLYRAIERPAMSLVLTIVSLGTRVALSYALAPTTPLGVTAIWWAIPIGWILSDLTGFLYYKKLHKTDQSLH